MAGIGAAPKDPSQRRNKSAPMRGEWVDLAPLEELVLPVADAEWPEHVQMLWEAWRQDPVTAQYSPSDRAAVYELARRYDRLQPNEQRLRADGLGLTPKGKRDLRWRIQSDAEAAKPKARRSAAASSREARLSVVK